MPTLEGVLENAVSKKSFTKQGRCCCELNSSRRLVYEIKLQDSEYEDILGPYYFVIAFGAKNDDLAITKVPRVLEEKGMILGRKFNLSDVESVFCGERKIFQRRRME